MKVYVVTKDYQNLGTYEDRIERCGEFVGVFKNLESAKKGIESDIYEDFEIPKPNDYRLKEFYIYDGYYENHYDKQVLYHKFYIDYDSKRLDEENYLYLYEVNEYEI